MNLWSRSVESAHSKFSLDRSTRWWTISRMLLWQKGLSLRKICAIITTSILPALGLTKTAILQRLWPLLSRVKAAFQMQPRLVRPLSQTKLCTSLRARDRQNESIQVQRTSSTSLTKSLKRTSYRRLRIKVIEHMSIAAPWAPESQKSMPSQYRTVNHLQTALRIWVFTAKDRAWQPFSR